MQITSSTNIKSFNKGRSYDGLRKNHFNLKDRERKGISKNKNFKKLNQHYSFTNYKNELDDIYKQLEKDIEEYNKRPSQVDHKSRRHKDLADYVEKRKSRKNINKDFHGLEYMMVSKLGSMESWQEVVNEFEKHNVSEEDTLNCLNRAFAEYFMDFNKSFSSHGLMMIEADTNLDEIGAPHMHSRIFLSRKLKNGLPDTNLSNALKSKYGEKLNNRELMEKFRFDLDNSLVERSNVALKKLAKKRGFEYEGLELIRLKSEEVGLTHRAYIEKKERERRQKELDERKKELDKREKDLNEREEQIQLQQKEIQSQKEDLKAQKALLDKREVEISQREKEIDEILKNTTTLLNNVKKLEYQIKNNLKNFDINSISYINEALINNEKLLNQIQKRLDEYQKKYHLENTPRNN